MRAPVTQADETSTEPGNQPAFAEKPDPQRCIGGNVGLERDRVPEMPKRRVCVGEPLRHDDDRKWGLRSHGHSRVNNKFPHPVWSTTHNTSAGVPPRSTHR
jgi:hypothetical protein